MAQPLVEVKRIVSTRAGEENLLNIKNLTHSPKAVNKILTEIYGKDRKVLTRTNCAKWGCLTDKLKGHPLTH